MNDLSLPRPFELQAFDSLDSTNDEAKRQAGKGAPDATVVWAEEQTAGRGRGGRQWISERGNLYASFILRPDCPAARLGEFAFIAANAVAETVSNMVPGKAVTCKWPNDIMIDGKKVAGLLLESETKGDKVDWLVLGVGINIHHHPEDADILYPATDVNAEGALEVRVSGVLEALCGNLQHQRKKWERGGFEPIREAWLKHAQDLGNLIEVRMSKRSLAGVFRGLDEHGALLLEHDGTTETVLAGDVFPVG